VSGVRFLADVNGGGLAISVAIFGAIVAHARDDLPNEACGLIGGDLATGRATRYHPARNATASRYAYEVEASDLIRIMDAVEADGDALVAIVHSHPATPATPSASDIRGAAYPVVHVIVTLADAAVPTLRGWRIEAGTAREVPLRIEAAQQSPTERWSTISR
jgi:proteasome lid subunit RPN8/RPN11